MGSVDDDRLTDFNAGVVTRVDVAGGVEPFPTASTRPRAGSQPRGVTVDAAGDVWWAQSGTNKIAISTSRSSVARYILL